MLICESVGAHSAEFFIVDGIAHMSFNVMLHIMCSSKRIRKEGMFGDGNVRGKRATLDC